MYWCIQDLVMFKKIYRAANTTATVGRDILFFLFYSNRSSTLEFHCCVIRWCISASEAAVCSFLWGKTCHVVYVELPSPSICEPVQVHSLGKSLDYKLVFILMRWFYYHLNNLVAGARHGQLFQIQFNHSEGVRQVVGKGRCLQRKHTRWHMAGAHSCMYTCLRACFWLLRRSKVNAKLQDYKTCEIGSNMMQVFYIIQSKLCVFKP